MKYSRNEPYNDQEYVAMPPHMMTNYLLTKVLEDYPFNALYIIEKTPVAGHLTIM
jgi:hypothetical protein